MKEGQKATCAPSSKVSAAQHSAKRRRADSKSAGACIREKFPGIGVRTLHFQEAHPAAGQT
jgi:hypothetical protein